MSVIVTKTADKISFYPQHTHKVAEIICYIEGEGVMKTERGDINFSKGTVLIIPKGIKHGSVSGLPFKNICVHTDELNYEIKDILKGSDNIFNDAYNMANLLFRLSLNAEDNKTVIKSVLSAYTDLVFSLLKVYGEKDEVAVFRDLLVKNISNPYFSVYEAEKNSGYAVDYFRALFKKRYNVTPCSYLTRIRMELAKNTLYVYGNKIKIEKLSLDCGYEDALYFSKIFKKFYGVSPKRYLGKLT